MTSLCLRRFSQLHGLPPAPCREQRAEQGRGEERLGQHHLTFASGQAHTMNLPCGQRVREPHCQPVGGSTEKPCHSQDCPQRPGPETRWGMPGPHSLERSTGSTLQSQFSGKKLRTMTSSSSIRSSSCSTSWAGDSGDGGEEGSPSQASPPISRLPWAAHLGRGPPGSWSGSCGGPRQTCNRTRRARGRPAGAHGLPAAHRCAPWAASSSRPDSSAWCLEKNTGPLPGQGRLGRWEGLKPLP